MWFLCSTDRPQRCQATLDSMVGCGLSTPGRVLVNGPDQIEAYRNLRLPENWSLIELPENLGICGALNWAFRLYHSEPWYGMACDDELVFTPDFDNILVNAAGRWKCAHGDDGWRSSYRLWGFLTIGGDLVRACGWWALPGLWHWYFDDVWETIAAEFDANAFCRAVKTEHRHTDNGKVPMDAVYALGRSRAAEDRQRFDRWKAAEWPKLRDRIRTAMRLPEVRRKPQAAPKRNLIYHIWPRRGTGVWQWNVAQLLRRIDQFDGVRAIGVATDGETDPLETVQAAFGETRIDRWVQVQNDPELGEAATFGDLLRTVPWYDDSITFYGHAKGGRHEANDQVMRAWSTLMYEACLDGSEKIHETLMDRPVAGAFKNVHLWTEKTRHGWHFSGTFFWFRNVALFTRNWQSIPREYHGVEKYLGNLFTAGEATCLFGEGLGSTIQVADMPRLLAEKRARERRVIPVYINARNLVTPLRRMVGYLKRIPNARVIIVDNDSTWSPLLEWYDSAECDVEVIRTGINGGKFGWAAHLLDHAALGVEKYVVTDSDLILDDIPLDVLDVLARGLDANPNVTKIGLSLDLDSIPPDYQFAARVKDWESQFWNVRRGSFWNSGIDTTFSMRRAADPVAFETVGHLRCDRPYTAVHWPWEWTAPAIRASEEIQHYISTSEAWGLMWTPQQQAAITA